MPKPTVDPKEAARWLAERLKRDQHEVPQGQAKGPFRKLQRAYVECPKCTRMFADPKRPVAIGVPKQHARQHAEEHKQGRVKKWTTS